MRKILLSAIVSGLLLTTLSAKDTKPLTSKEVSKKALIKATNNAKDSKVQLVQEAIESLKLSTKALADLEKNNSKEAKKNIELALGKLESILSVENAPKLLPIDNNIVVKNFVGTSKDVKDAIKRVKEFLNDDKVQEARVLLNTLQSEIDITVVNLPLSSYPDALKLASKYIIEGKPQKAKEVLKVALTTFAEINHIIPIPLVNSVDLVNAASEIAKKDKEQAIKYLQAASDELNKAEALGYISKSTTTYKNLHDLIKKIEKEIKGKNKAEKMFDELKEKLKDFRDKIFQSKDKDKK